MSMLPPLQYPDVEAAVIAYLTAGLGPGVPVSSEIQPAKPSTFVLVERAGGPRVDSIFEVARLACQFWGPTKQAAQALGAQCRDLLGRMPSASPLPSGFSVYRVNEFLGLTWAPDELGDVQPTPRYLLTVEARFRALPKGP